MTKRSGRAKTGKRSVAARQSAAVKRSAGTQRAKGARRANGRKAAPSHRRTLAPSRKTVAATLGSAFAALALYLTNKGGASPAVSTEMASLVTVAATFAASWLVPPGAREAIIETERGHRMASA